MKYKIKTSDVLKFEKKWNDLGIGEFHMLTREIDFVNKTTTISIPKEFADRVKR